MLSGRPDSPDQSCRAIQASITSACGSHAAGCCCRPSTTASARRFNRYLRVLSSTPRSPAMLRTLLPLPTSTSAQTRSRSDSFATKASRVRKPYPRQPQDNAGKWVFFKINSKASSAVVDGPDINRVLQVAVDSLDLMQLLVTHGYVLGAHVLATGADQVLAIQLGFGGDFGLVDYQLAVLLLPVVSA